MSSFPKDLKARISTRSTRSFPTNATPTRFRAPGLIELLAREMTADLRAQRRTALNDARANRNR
jgi:hypothetical protein